MRCLRRPSSSRALGLALFAVSFGTNVPTPLLLRYRGDLDLSPTVLTIIFGVYAAGLVPTLFVAGPASDRYGRRAVVIPFTVVAALASMLFLGASRSLPLLLVGRLLQGAVSGAVFSVGSAWMGELVTDPGTAARRATTALSLGFALGPLTSGILGQYAPAPLIVPYLVHLTLLVAGLWVLHGVPETLDEPHPDRPWLNLGVPRAARAPFLAFAVPAGLCVFTFPSVAVTVLPLGLQAAMPGRDVVVTGVVAGLTMTAGVLVQQVERRVGPGIAAPLGAGLGMGGVAMGLLGITLETPWLLLPASVLLGGGYGLTLAAGLTATQLMAAPNARGALTSTFYAVTYLGFGVPVVLAALSDGTDFTTALIGLIVIGVVLTIILAVGPGRRWLPPSRARPQWLSVRGSGPSPP